MHNVQPNFFQLPILSGISRNLALTEIQAELSSRGGKGREGKGNGGTSTTATASFAICLLWF
jgi:hypothetical protein